MPLHFAEILHKSHFAAGENAYLARGVGRDIHIVNKNVFSAYKTTQINRHAVFFGVKTGVTEAVRRVPLIGFNVAGDNGRIPYFARLFILDIYKQPVSVGWQIVKVVSAYTPYFGRFVPT